MLVYQMHELDIHIEPPARSIVAILGDFSEYAAKPVCQREQEQPALVGSKNIVVAVAHCQQL
jgi:hypothetical protein